jgi:hypothetical protein
MADDSVRVVARFRPFNARERGIGSTDESCEVFQFNESSVAISSPNHPDLKFNMNRVFDPSSTQQEVYENFGAETIQ